MRFFSFHIYIKNKAALALAALCFILNNKAQAQISALTGIDGADEKPAIALRVDASPNVKADPKASFKNLFISTGSNKKAVLLKGIKTEHLNPQAVDFVADYVRANAADLYRLRQTGKPYFDMMDDVLTQNGIPKELKYLAVIESFLKANARSWVGAVGPWQFMPQTARELGLNVSGFMDERQDYLKSTRAASKYLNHLYNIYGDWLLVVAAYNCGPGRVNSAINKSGSSNFWNLQYYLPAESRNHVKKFIATHYIMEGQGSEATDKNILNKHGLVADGNNIIINIEGRYNATAIAQALDIPLASFTKMNPNLERTLATNQPYPLHLPKEKAPDFLNKKNEILNQSLLLFLSKNNGNI